LRASWGTAAQAAEYRAGVFDVLEEHNPPAFLEQEPLSWRLAAATIEPLDQVQPKSRVAFPKTRRAPFRRRVTVVEVVAEHCGIRTFRLCAIRPLPVRSGSAGSLWKLMPQGGHAWCCLLTPANEATRRWNGPLQRGTAHGEAHGCDPHMRFCPMKRACDTPILALVFAAACACALWVTFGCRHNVAPASEGRRCCESKHAGKDTARPTQICSESDARSIRASRTRWRVPFPPGRRRLCSAGAGGSWRMRRAGVTALAPMVGAVATALSNQVFEAAAAV
jgi:hypothetical protein